MEPAVASPQPVDLTNCDREPIHIPGAILPHGAMLVLDRDSLEVAQAAGDTQGLLGLPVEAVLGRAAEALFRPDQVQRLRELCEQSDLAKPRHLLDPILRLVPDRPLDASAHKSDELLVLEFEAADTRDRHVSDPLGCVHELLDGLDALPSLQAFCQVAAERVRGVTGYDRVMIYRFLEDGAGWVFAESREERLAPFLDLHYPASDIPKQARALYLRTWLRLICQVEYEPAPLLPPLNPRTGQPLDMSQATLRDVSPIHREYLRNMGVDASMSISIIREGKLWGLVACHHYSPKKLPRHLRAACELFGAMFSLQLEARERAEQFKARTASRKVLQKLMRNLAEEDDYGQGLVRNTPNLLDYISAGGLALRVAPQGGVAVRVNSAVTMLGVTPTEEQIAALTDWLSRQMEGGDGLFVTDRLGELWRPAKAFAGVGSGLLAISVSREPRDFILWFRPEVVANVSWGGDPAKPVELGPNGARLTPRKSFEVWQETVRGRASAWLPSDGDAAFDLRVALLEVVLRRIDAAARERERAYAQERLLMAELDHRVKNTLASIQVLVTQTSRYAESLADFAQQLVQRIQSMSRAHSLLTQSRWEGVSIATLLHEELDHYGQAGATVSLSGPEVALTPKAALALSLAVHELVANAAKYGALSRAAGRVLVSWAPVRGRGIDIIWRESDGPAVSPPRRRGFGSTLIERALALETGGRSKLHFPSEGVRCDIFLPASSISRIEADQDAPPASEAQPDRARPTASPSARRRVLVVEDSALLIMTLEDLLADMGWDLVGPATRVADALALVRDERIDAALLDINLDGEMSWDVALLLKERSVPFAFTTGYDGATVLPGPLANSPVVSKPFRTEDIERQLRDMVETPDAGRRQD